MKKKLLPLALAAAAGLTGVTAQAQTMSLNSNGTGQLLMYPIYTANGGNDTYISVANTKNEYKAVKVRFVDAMNSQDSLDFHLYLSPFDHWSGVMTKDAAGGAVLKTGDTSCTVPNSIAATAVGGLGTPTLARNAKYGPGGAEADTINNGIDRSLEGHVEIIEMGILPTVVATDPKQSAGGTGTGNYDADGVKAIAALKTAIKHVNGVPGKCSDLQAAWTTKVGTVDSAAGAFAYTDSNSTPGNFADAAVTLAAPTGGLYGYGVIINVPDGTAAMFDAVAVDGFMSNGYHPTPGDDEPGMDDGVNQATLNITATGVQDTFVANPAESTGVVGTGTATAIAAAATSANHVSLTRGKTGSRLLGGGNLATLTTGSTGDAGSKEALSALLARTSLSNDYVLEPALNAATDWVVTFPTKRDFVNLNAIAAATPSAANQPKVEAPFSALWNHALTTSCDNIAIQYYDREEGVNVVDVQFDISPAPVVAATSASLCTESNIINYNGKGVLAGSDRINQNVTLASGFNNGWATVSFTGANAVLGLDDSTASPNTVVAKGLPVIGFAIQKYVNGAAGGAGVLANYAGSIGHHYTSSVTTK